MLRFFWFAVLLLVPSVLVGQIKNTAGVNIHVSASIRGSIEFLTIESIDFRNANRIEFVAEVDPLQNSGAGKMIARGTPGAEFRLDYLRQRELVNAEGPGILYITYHVGGNRIDEQETAELLGQEIRDLEFNNEGEFYIWIGGQVNLKEAVPGSYEGEFTIEIEYI